LKSLAAAQLRLRFSPQSASRFGKTASFRLWKHTRKKSMLLSPPISGGLFKNHAFVLALQRMRLAGGWTSVRIDCTMIKTRMFSFQVAPGQSMPARRQAG